VAGLAASSGSESERLSERRRRSWSAGSASMLSDMWLLYDSGEIGRVSERQQMNEIFTQRCLYFWWCVQSGVSNLNVSALDRLIAR
jgi:hypothetical protein